MAPKPISLTTLALAAVAFASCLAPSVQAGIAPVDGCAQDRDCPAGYHCADEACQLQPRPCWTKANC
ncbi:MAG: hypothetical protein ACYCWW_20510, partial [Deltaproteobacteria bacterium]